MVYELRPYRTVDDWTNERDLGVIVWETDEITDATNFKICGELVSCLGFDDKIFTVPDGIESIGYSVFTKGEWEAFHSFIPKLIIPSSVKKIEEGAFVGAWIDEIEIHPDSNCAKVINNGLYTYNEETLLWVIKSNEDGDVFIVPDGVKRIGAGALPWDCIRILILPESVTEIGWDDEFSYCYDDVVIKAPANSYAIEFAKEHNIKYVEM